MAIDLTKPLFIPLLGRWFDAFAAGEKHDEWRRLGQRWHLALCPVGRPVILSRGYSGARLSARVKGASIKPAQSPEAVALYGAGTPCLVIALDAIGPLARS